jgi:hypothetical protein
MQKGTRRKRSAYRKDHTSLEGADFEVNTTLNRQNGQGLQGIFLINPADVTKVTQQKLKDSTHLLSKKDLRIGRMEKR